MSIMSKGPRRGMRGGRVGGIPFRFILIAVFAGGAWLFKNNKLPDWVGDLFGEPKAGAEHAQVSDFETIEGTKLQSDKGNDGDSFQIRHKDGVHHLRLYYVDTPEKYISKYNSERVGHQARYFGCEKNDAVDVGVDAKKVTEGLLKQNPFRVHTVWEEVYDSGRYYAFIELNPGTDDAAYLCEHLASVGLCRIYTKGVATPDGRSFGSFKSHLQKLESQAKKEKLGGWGK